MKRSLSIFIVFFIISLLSGCLLSKTPNANDVSMNLGDHMTFSVNVFPPATYTWTLDDAPLTNPGNSYVYTAQAGGHILVVKAKHFLGTDTQAWNLLTNNSPPVAHTGPEQTVAEKELVTLDASNSTDPDNDIFSYAWEQIGGTQVVLSNPDAITTTFQTPDLNNGSEALSFKLTVTDSKGLTDTATCIVNVTWQNDPPTADAGPDQSVAAGAVVMLNGSSSSEPDDGIASYLWAQTGGPTVPLINAVAAIAQFTAGVASGSVLTFELTVTDTGGLQAKDTCIITVTSSRISELLSTLVSIPGGTFQMGSTLNPSEMPIHEVTLPSFEIGAYEVTQTQYLAVMGTNPSFWISYPGSDNNPVETVSWYDARAFCTALSALTGRTFTLPSEAQWEYACRAGTTTLYSYGDSDALLGNYAWWWYNSDGTGGPYGTHPVGDKLPNNWGLYDMMGNVWEWCLDSWHTNYTGAPTDGSAWEPETGTYRIIRGGSWNNSTPEAFRSAFRNNYNPDGRNNNLGFRVLAVPASE